MTPREPLKWKHEGKQCVARFRHPLVKTTVLKPGGKEVVVSKMVRLPLGTDSALADRRLRDLNTIFLHPENWANPPAKLDPLVLAAWGVVGRKTFTVPTVAAVTFKAHKPMTLAEAMALDSRGALDATDDDSEAVADTEKETLRQLLAESEARAKQHVKTIETLLGKKMRATSYPTLQQAYDDWLAAYKGRDDKHTRNLSADLRRLVAHFKPATHVDALDGKEAALDAWLRGLTVTLKKHARYGQPISAGRRDQVRKLVLGFLIKAGATLNRDAVTMVKKKEIERDRGAIRWLEKKQAEKLHAALPAAYDQKARKEAKGWVCVDADYWRDVFQFQTAMGVRASELVTLKKADFTADYAVLTLSPHEKLTLKNGSRTLQVPAALRAMLKRRLHKTAFLFPDYITGQPYTIVETFEKRYSKALQVAKAAAKIPFQVDCRTARRTCGSLLVRAGVSFDNVAALLGDDVKTVKAHYASIKAHEVSNKAAVIGG